MTEEEKIKSVLNTAGGEALVAYVRNEINEFERKEKARLAKILIQPNDPVEELVALKVIVRAKSEVIGFLERLIALKDYEKAEPELKDENFGV
ncbi:MAG: hypothetical protein NUV80_01050 [Candidatus Berkelbacteria bacterium]|nr:hypothetical protein [Candidatus Berkelbacteria bacterium]